MGFKTVGRYLYKSHDYEMDRLMSLKRPKPAAYESAEEAQFYAAHTLPAMHNDTATVIPLVLEVPLFAVARRKAASEPVPTVNAVWSKKGRGFLRYEGPQLTQSHLTVLLTLINRRAKALVSSVFEFRPSELLAVMGWSDNQRNISRLIQLLDDLKHGQVRLWKEGQNEARNALRVSFVDKFQPSDDKAWTVVLSTDLMPIFEGNLTFVNLPTRAALTEGLATFLYGYISANSGALPITYRQLHAACGSGTSDMGEFANSAKAALARLKEAGAIQDYKLQHGGFRVMK